MQRLMRRVVLGTVVTFLAISVCSGKSLKEYLFPELNLFKADIAKNMDAIAKVDTKVGSVNTKVNAQAALIGKLGFNNTSTSVGGNQSINTTNSDAVVKELLTVFKVIIGAMLLQLVGLLKFQANLYTKLLREKDAQIERLAESRSRKEEKLDEWQQKMIEGKLSVQK